MTVEQAQQIQSALAGAVSHLNDAKAEIRSLEAELVATRTLADDWRNIAIQLAATCRDLRGDLAAARRPVASFAAQWAGYRPDESDDTNAQ